jgi:tyrosine-protein kinase Etk/Wzc
VSATNTDTIELGHVARRLSSGWRTIVGFTVMGILLSVAVILFAPRKFTGKTTVVLRSGSGSPSSALSQIAGLGDLTAGLMGGKSSMETEIEVIQSRSLISEVIDSLKLQAQVFGKQPIAAAEVISSLDASGSFSRQRFRFTKQTATTFRYEGPGGTGEMRLGSSMRFAHGAVTFAATAALPAEFELVIRDREDALKWVDRNLKAVKEKGEVASITYKGRDSLTAARVPNTLLNAYLARRKGTDRGINQRRVEFLTAKSDSMERALLFAGQALRDQQERSGVIDPEAVAKVELESGAALRAKLTDVQVEQGALKHLLDRVNSNALDSRDLAAYPKFLGSPTINSIVSTLSELETRRTVLLSTHQETDREIVAIDKSTANLKAKLVPYAQTYADALTRQRADLETSLAKIDAIVARLPRAAESSTRLQREVLELSKLSAVIQAQIVDAKLAAIGEGGDVRPLDTAFVPKKPSFPAPILTAGVGAVGGLLCGLMAALLMGSVGRWVRDPDEVERTTGVPALQFDPAVPLMLTNATSRTILVAPVEAGVSVGAVASRLAQTATSRSLSAVILDLSGATADVNGSIQRLEASHDVVIVQLSSLVSDAAAAALQHTRPVLLVAPGRRVDRRRLTSAVQLLKRLEVPVAGIVMSDTANGRHALTP